MSISPVLMMLIGATLISSAPIWVTLAGVPASVSAFYRVLFGAIILTPLIWQAKSWRKVSSKVLLGYGLAAVFFSIDLSLWHQSILYIGAGMSTLIVNFQVFFLAVAGALFLGESLRKRFVIAVVLAIIGLWFVAGVNWQAFSAQSRIGVYLALLAALCYSGYLLSLQWTQKLPEAGGAKLSLWWLCIFASILLAIISFTRGDSLAFPSASALWYVIAYALVCQVLGWMFIVTAMPKLRASTVGLMLLLQPSLAYVWEVQLFDRQVANLELIGVSLALFGIFLGSTRKSA